MPAAPLLPDDPVRLGRYHLLGRLGEGGMGVVYLGRSPGGRATAVKVIRPRFAADGEYRARFGREITAARAVTGAFTAPVLDAAPEDDPPWVASAYVAGVTLREAVDRCGALPAHSLRLLAAGLAEALTDIHRAGVVHRDLKPGNVLLTADGPRVIDFGIARVAGATTITRAGALVGTPGFIAPELVRGDPAGPPGDVFALGAVLAFAATGRAPFGSGSAWVRLLRAERAEADLDGLTDEALHALVTACLRRDPGSRPSPAEVLHRAGTAARAAPHAPGTAWWPAQVAELVDQSAATPPGPPSATAVPEPAAAPGTGAGPAAGAGAEEATQTGAGPRQLTRRTLLGTGAAAGAVAVAGTVLVRATRDRVRSGAAPAGPAAPSAPAAPVSSPAGPVPRATPRWSVRTGEEQPVLGVAGGLPIAVDEGRAVTALDPVDGRVRWQRPVFEGATAGGALVYAVQDDFVLAAFDAATGGTVWTWRAPFGDFFHPGPVHGGSRVVLGSDRVRAVGVADGRLHWTTEIGVVGALAADDDVVAVRTSAGTSLVGLAAADGTRRWTHPAGFAGDPVLGDRLMFLTDMRGEVRAVDTGTGAVTWRRTLSLADDRLRHENGRLYASAFDGMHGSVVALRASTGEPLWQRRIGRDASTLDAANAVAVHRGVVLVSGTDGVLHALDAATGRPRWQHDTGGPAGPAVVAGDLVYYPSHDGTVHAVAPPAEAPRAGR